MAKGVKNFEIFYRQT